MNADTATGRRRGSSRRSRQLSIFRPARKPVMTYNPAIGEEARQDAEKTRIAVFKYKDGAREEKEFDTAEEAYGFIDKDGVSWINVDGLRRKEVREICSHFQVHQLTVDDILSIGQRAKMDEFGDMIYCLLPMLYFNAEFNTIEKEQVSLLLMKGVVLSFQEDPSRDAFNPVREKLSADNSRLWAGGPDALYNALLDAIVDQYFGVMEALGYQIEDVEELVLREAGNRTLVRVNHFRREVNQLRRSIGPVRELVNGILRSESTLIQKKTRNYFKDIYDHIIQANDIAENYRELIIGLQDLYLNQMNLKMNVIMKVLAVVTALFAPLTLITGIYGMNFDNMPELHTRYGYFITLGAMLVLFSGMLVFFRKRGWF